MRNVEVSILEIIYKCIHMNRERMGNIIKQTGLLDGINNKAAIDLQCKSSVKLIAAFFLFCLVILFEENANGCVLQCVPERWGT